MICESEVVRGYLVIIGGMVQVQKVERNPSHLNIFVFDVAEMAWPEYEPGLARSGCFWIAEKCASKGDIVSFARDCLPCTQQLAGYLEHVPHLAREISTCLAHTRGHLMPYISTPR